VRRPLAVMLGASWRERLVKGGKEICWGFEWKMVSSSRGRSRSFTWWRTGKDDKA